jgi:hypothetical protein
MFQQLLKKIRNSWFHGLNQIVPVLGFCREYRVRNDEEMVRQKRLNNPLYLEKYGFKVYSQNDEDGIIEEIFKRIGTTNKEFVEFGVQNGLESNGHYLLNKGWTGHWIEGNKSDCLEIQNLFAPAISNGHLTITNAFITRENINDLITNVTGGGEIDFLSIDIDGNDYWVWQAITCVKPRVVCIEYNAQFPPTYEYVLPYDAKFVWIPDSDEFGASLKSLEKLGNELGYQLVGTNLNGVNAFFVQKEITQDKFYEPATAEELYNPYRFINYVNMNKSHRFIGK